VLQLQKCIASSYKYNVHSDDDFVRVSLILFFPLKMQLQNILDYKLIIVLFCQIINEKHMRP